MRLLLPTPDFPPAHGGIQLVAAGLAEHLHAQTRVVTLASGNGVPTPGVRRVRTPRKSGAGAAAARVREVLDEVAVRG